MVDDRGYLPPGRRRAPQGEIAENVRFVISQNRNLLTTHKPDDLTVRMLADKIAKHMRLCSYEVTGITAESMRGAGASLGLRQD
jgi:hypothetical protein